MKGQRIQKKSERTPEEIARIKALREKFQREKPTLETLVASGEYTEPITLGEYFNIQELLHSLKQHREAAGMSLADVADATGMDRAMISRLENGHQPNPTVDTIHRYAGAIGVRVGWSITSGGERPQKQEVTK